MVQACWTTYQVSGTSAGRPVANLITTQYHSPVRSGPHATAQLQLYREGSNRTILNQGWTGLKYPPAESGGSLSRRPEFNSGREPDYLNWGLHVSFSVPRGKFRDGTLNATMATSYHMPCNSLLTTLQSSQTEPLNSLNQRHSTFLARFEVLMTVIMKNTVFCNIMPFGSCENRRFGETYRLHH
jgi:hypothetical protein